MCLHLIALCVSACMAAEPMPVGEHPGTPDAAAPEDSAPDSEAGSMDACEPGAFYCHRVLNGCCDRRMIALASGLCGRECPDGFGSTNPEIRGPACTCWTTEYDGGDNCDAIGPLDGWVRVCYPVAGGCCDRADPRAPIMASACAFPHCSEGQVAGPDCECWVDGDGGAPDAAMDADVGAGG